MSASDLLDEIAERGYSLNYLRGPKPYWEASIVRPLPEQTPDGYVNAVGFGSGPLASIALDEALDRVENDYERLEPKCYANIDVSHLKPEPAPDLFALLDISPKPTLPFVRRL